MKKIKDFISFVNESLLLEKSKSTGSKNVFSIRAGASKTSLTPDLQGKLGIDGGTLYSIKLRGFFQLYDIWNNTFNIDKKWPALLSNKMGIEFKPIGKSKVRDYFKINNFEIKTAGEIKLAKSDLMGSLDIQVSGNGILTLTRLCHAIFEVFQRLEVGGSQITPNDILNYQITIILGGDAKTGKNRGYKFFYYSPGRLNTTRGAIEDMISVSALRYKFSGLNKKELKQYRFPGMEIGSSIEMICQGTPHSYPENNRKVLDKPLIKSLNTLINGERRGLLNRRFLVSSNDVDITSEWVNYSKGIDRYFVDASGKYTYSNIYLAQKFTPEGYEASKNLFDSIVNKLLLTDSSLPEDSENFIPKEFIPIIREGVQSDLSTNKSSFEESVLDVQSTRPPSSDLAVDKSSISSTEEVQEEGEF